MVVGRAVPRMGDTSRIIQAMYGPPQGVARTWRVAVLLLLALSAPSLYGTSWKGIVRDKAGHVVGEAIISLQATATVRTYTTKTPASGEFLFTDLEPLSYKVSVKVNDKTWDATDVMAIQSGDSLTADLELK